MNDELTKNRQSGKNNLSPEQQVLPKVYANFSHYNEQFNWVNYKKKEMQSGENIGSTKVSQNNGAPFSDAYLAAFNEFGINDNSKKERKFKAKKGKISWLNSIAGLILMLLTANLYFLVFPHNSSKQSNPQNKASLEFEAVVPLSASKIDNEVGSDYDLTPKPYKASGVELPKRRVLVISEDTRNELLKQLDDENNSEESSKDLNEYYPN